MNNIRWYQAFMLLLYALVTGQSFAQQNPAPRMLWIQSKTSGKTGGLKL